ncbi:helix-turn-helix domain-containing protein [Enterococcus mundtii]|uniref:helix-turn-helix domain-containing protein n=1 Tax=Enterococcus TaxID=1350 RepID=UPI000C25FDA0|nr:helix-turn-helix domain-containing protein [Enterococcus mundtii]EMF0401933.1 helix-turn-helix domain-containing protein [Enterococcus faecium]MDB7101885.1 helix-turn-helix domain-containing protein [Enterococcus mundtii]MDY4307191.1 helix-turn-helix domain-containing protein [Enterococcus mundtii]PJK27078.1 hypothetical protein CV769_01505 [Enterococcus mundtii]
MSQTINIPKESFSVKETAKIMNTSEHVIRNLIKTGELRAIKFGTLSIPLFEIRRFMKSAISSQKDYRKFSDPEMLKKNSLYKIN